MNKFKMIHEKIYTFHLFIFLIILSLTIVQRIFEFGSFPNFIIGGVKSTILISWFLGMFLSEYFDWKNILGFSAIGGLCIGMTLLHILENHLGFKVVSGFLLLFIITGPMFVASFAVARYKMPDLSINKRISIMLAPFVLFIFGGFIGLFVVFMMDFFISSPIARNIGLGLSSSLVILYGSRRVGMEELDGFRDIIYTPVGAGFTLASFTILLSLFGRWLSFSLQEISGVMPDYPHSWVILYDMLVILTGFILGSIVGYKVQLAKLKVDKKESKVDK